MTVGGPSTGGHFALTVALQSIDEGFRQPEALSVEFAPTDLGLGPEDRRSSKKHPIITPELVDLVKATYFTGVDVASPLASPIRHPDLGELAPLLVLTAEYDTLRAESERLAHQAADAGADVTYRMVAGVDHGFLATPPSGPALQGMTTIADHLRAAYATGADHDAMTKDMP